ncbi:hypothetical protein LAZ67_5001325 [Cordylochernes scorpioides]|uniref:Uncharacterized protein n=1 Tax=Cordylochernes scorpioides TaxID=51811 RepID=A0ABY6KFQ8_9ARAC|nr:hypothetical protein LAZ67_5001325 [Cordylochernes scorpioides]
MFNKCESYTSDVTQAGRTPFHTAAIYRNHELYRVLSDAGADPKIRDQKGRFPEYYFSNPIKPPELPNYAESMNLEPEPAEEEDVTSDFTPPMPSAEMPRNIRLEGTKLNELIQLWIKNKDLLRLEHVVIAGQGSRLQGLTSDDPHVQEFLDLVPTYMDRIKAVHAAVVRGSLAEVRAVLVRKRFALCRDEWGASPLHLAVLLGHTDILRYIVLHFPETLQGPDNEGRTPLHYAAAMRDGGHYYKILRASGADETIVDKSGHTAEHYLTNPGELTAADFSPRYPWLDQRPAKLSFWKREETPSPEVLLYVTGGRSSTNKGLPCRVKYGVVSPESLR